MMMMMCRMCIIIGTNKVAVQGLIHGGGRQFGAAGESVTCVTFCMGRFLV
ncbi:MAG: hypothetical protein HFG83_00680 [Dorea sp.]|nr:hypothetical protein [Dorea sp.]